MAGVQKQQAISLADEFLHDLVQELDHPDIVGITLGGSYARGTATEFSDVDLACFWREGVELPPKRFAPCNPVHATSPIAYNPGKFVAPFTSVLIPPH